MQPQRDTYDYTHLGQQADNRQNTVLRKTYGLLGLAFIPCVAGAVAATQFNFMSFFGNSWLSIIAFFAFFYGMCFAIEKNRYSGVGVAFLMVFTFGLGLMLGPVLQLALFSVSGARIVGMAAAMTAAVFLVMAVMARRTKADMNGLGQFLTVGAVVLMVGVVANLFFHIPALALTISAGFVIFSSLMIMWQIRTVIDGGEDSPISAALNIFVSLYNIFLSLLNILLSLNRQ